MELSPLCPGRPRPAYAHRPGQTPHPRSHPDGHCRDTPEPEPVAVSATAWRQSTEYLFGFDLYNEGYFWEAHEAWEHLWRGADADPALRDFLQGIIQVAGSALKVAVDNRKGARTLAARAADHLERVAQSPYMGIDVRHLAATLRRTHSPPAHLAPR